MSSGSKRPDGDGLRPETLAAQALGRIDDATRAVVPPIHPSTTYLRDPDGAYRSGRGYTRADNPTYDTPEDLLATLEGGESCLLFASGMAAAVAVFQALLPGDHVIAPRTMYWALRKWLGDFPVSWGLEVEFIDTTDLDNLASSVRPGTTRLVWIETPANPTWEITDIAAAARIAHDAGARLAVDSTVATPVLSRPIEHGADLVVHSATKYLNGHSDVLAGAVVGARRDGFWYRIRAWQRDAGGVLGPFEAWLLLRGMRTLFPRVRQCSESAARLAQHLVDDPRVTEVLYPGLPAHPGHAVAARQMSGGFGGMLSLRVKGGEPAAVETAAHVAVFKRATSLGGVESLIEHRASIEGPATPVPFDLLRLSVGLESPDDLIADLEQALDAGERLAAALPASASASASIANSADVDAEVERVLESIVRPVIRDRGGDIAIAGLDGGALTLEISGSPGAALPLQRWAEHALAQRVPAVESVQFRTPRGPEPRKKPSGDSAVQLVSQVLTEQVNPAVAAHGGKVSVVSATPTTVEIRFEGRCQGCAMSEVTLRQGIEPLIKTRMPQLVALLDCTDHGAGGNPYFSPGKASAPE